MLDFSTLESCKATIMAVLSVPKGADPSEADYFLVNQWGGFRFAFMSKFVYHIEKLTILPRLPGCDMVLFDRAVRELFDEGKIVQYKHTLELKGVSLQIVAGLPGREQDFLPKHAAA